MNPSDFAQLGVGIAAVVVNFYIVVAFLKFLGNHLSGLSKSLGDSARANERVADRLERLEEKIEWSHSPTRER